MTVQGGSRSDGCAIVYPPMVTVPVFDHTLPFIAWPQEVQARITQRTLIMMAGEVAALMLASQEPVTSRIAPDVTERAAGIVSVPEPALDVVTQLREWTWARSEPVRPQLAP